MRSEPGSTVVNAIDAEHVAVTYSDGTEAVRDVSIRVPRGEFFGFLGPNGAGKTTTIKTLVTLLRPTGGRIRVNGYDVVEEPEGVRGTVGYMAQETSVDPELTARENLRFACEAYHVPSGDREARIDELLELVDLADVADKRAKSFSGGMQKRLDAATALVHEPPLVFLDEPTTGLDPKARIRLWEYFREINDAGTTVFLTTQYLEEADQLCDRLSIVLDGEIVATGSPTELKSRVGGDVLEVTLADADPSERERAARTVRDAGLLDPDDEVEPVEEGLSITSKRARAVGTDLLVALDREGFDVTGFNVRSPTLDDVFLAVTGGTWEEATGDEDASGAPAAEEGTPVTALGEEGGQ
jgi:ABC-2 type transport system ATP-binding protein